MKQPVSCTRLQVSHCRCCIGATACVQGEESESEMVGIYAGEAMYSLIYLNPYVHVRTYIPY